MGPTTGGPNVPIRNPVWRGRRDDRYAAALKPFPYTIPVPRVLWSSRCILHSSQPLVSGNHNQEQVPSRVGGPRLNP